MTLKSILLGSTAIAGAALLAAPAYAGSAQTGDNYTLELSGELEHNISIYDQDVSDGRGRGYRFSMEDLEVYIHAGAKADNGIKYGIRLELNANPDDTTAADEAWAYISGDRWGHLELGDNDDAADRMFVNAESVMAANAGWDGRMFDVVNTGTAGGITDSFVSNTGDASKIIYFTPRIAGFQLGASLTPDTGHNGLSAVERDDDGDFENVVDLGVNWEGSFGDFGILLSATYETGSGEPNTSAGANTNTSVEDPEVWSIGGKVTFGGFALAAGYADFNETGLATAVSATGADAGNWWNVGASYATGPWTVSLAYLDTTKDNGGGLGSTDWQVISAGVTYNLAPGWNLSGEIDVFEGDNINATAVPVDNDGTVFLITNGFYF